MPTRRTCYIACPAFALRGPTERHKTIDHAAWFANEMNLEVVPSPLLDRHLGNGSWLPLEERRDDLVRALDHDVVWACRGGFGSIELAETLLRSRRRHGPLLIGYSDLTVLHCGWRVHGWRHHFYGAIAPRRAGSRQGESLLALARGEGLRLGHFQQAGARVLRPGRARGELFPACLSVLAGLCGTPLQPDLRGAVLAIEDIDVHPFLVDFNLNQLHLSGTLDGVVALLGGSFTHEERGDYLGPSIDEVLAKWAARLRIPTLARLPYGHMDDALVLPYRAATSISLRGDGQWSVAIAGTALDLMSA